MSEREVVLYAPDSNISQRSELLGTTVDFASKYAAAINRLGLEIVHRRNPSEPRDILCMDEGLTPYSNVTVRLAGPVPLLARTLPLLKEGVANGIVYSRVFDHAHCGALGLNLAEIGEGMDIDPQKAGAFLAGRFAKELTRVYPDHEVAYGGRLSLTRRPKDQHTGQVIYYDARNAGLDFAHLANFPPGYTISRNIFGPDASRECVSLALGITFGAHGLSTKLTPSTPLYLVGIVDGQEQMGKIADELRLIQSSQGINAGRMQVQIIAA